MTSAAAIGQAGLAPVRVRVVTSAQELAALAGDWERLQRDATAGSVFSSFDWQHLWWKSYGGDQPLRLLVASADGGAAGSTVVGLLPLYIHTVPMLRFPVRLLRFVGTGGDTFPDDLGPLIEAGREAEIARAFADAIMALPGWDVLLLTDLDPAGAFTAAMQSVARAGQLRCLAGRGERIAYLDLPPTWDAWLKSLSGDRRYRVRNIRKKLNAAHPTRFFVWDDPATLDQGIDRLIHLHHKRWKNVGQTHAFSSPQYIGFHRAVMAACLARDRLRLYCLELSGEVVAMYYFYKFGDRVYLMQSGFDPDFSSVKPGQVLLGYIVEHAIGEGHKVLDFLKGDHRYKDELATGERETVYLTAFRGSAGAWVYRARRRYLPALKAYLKPYVEKAIRRVRPAAAAPPDPTAASSPAAPTATE
jgi:CelD/BcsL family acetyltransferase involved in cellulose biosynthesis